MKKAIEVEIMGERVTLRTDEDEDHVRNVAGYVDRKMQEIIKGTRPTAKSSIAMLAALNIADEYQRLKDHHAEISQRVTLLLKRLTTNLTEEG
ncbi:MAG TPA: cell division protein ZapA [Candidatus Binatia bacterium]|jgi:cell division protein ZapA